MVNPNKSKKIVKGESAAAKYGKFMPDTDEIMGFAEELISFGKRRPGTSEGDKARDYVREQFENNGMERVEIIKARNDKWDCNEYALSINGSKINCYYMSHTFCNEEYGTFGTPSNGIEAEIIYVGSGCEKDFKGINVEGKIVVADVEFGKLPVAGMKLRSNFFYDPDKTMSIFGKEIDPYSPKTFPYNYYYAQQRGAVGFVGILKDYFNSCTYNNEDYSYVSGNMKIPGFWVSGKEGENIKQLIRSNGVSVKANLIMRGLKSRVDTGAVVGFLAGKSEETIMVHSHFDSVTSGATEDGSGMAVVLAMAKFFSSIPKEKRERTLMFVGTDTHFTDYDTHDAIVDRFLGKESKILCDICIEHIAEEMIVDKNGEAVMTGQVAPRLIFVNKNTNMLNMVAEEIVRHNLDRSILMVAEKFGEEIVTDADMFYRAGIKVISMVSGQLYLYDEMDTIDKIPRKQMKPVTEAFCDMVLRVMRLDKKYLKRDMNKCEKSLNVLGETKKMNEQKEKRSQIKRRNG